MQKLHPNLKKKKKKVEKDPELKRKKKSYKSFKCPVTESIVSDSAGPIATTVLDPGATLT